jgi:hypothetical protein
MYQEGKGNIYLIAKGAVTEVLMPKRREEIDASRLPVRSWMLKCCK